MGMCYYGRDMKILVIIPTYNESKNIKNIIQMVFSKNLTGFTTHVLVVDDNSPDGTAEIVKRQIDTAYPQSLFLLSRKRKLGLGTAYIEGFQWGFREGYPIFVEMDADLSHNPIYLQPMLENLDNYDFIIGSKYISGGGIKGWGQLRKMISRFGTLYARLILGVPIYDLTGGFNIWKREVLKCIDPTRIQSEGYAFQIELKFKAFLKGFRFLEYPIVFEDRLRGKSKMSDRIILEAIYRVWQFKLFPNL